MHGNCGIFLLTYMVTVAIPVSLTFNIDTTNPVVYDGEKKDFFGYKVLQFMSGTNKGIIVTAPLKQSGSGGICNTGQAKCFYPEDISLEDTTIPVKHLGLSIAKDSERSQFTVCSPSVVHECDENFYLNSVCYNMTDNLQKLSELRPAFQDCTKKTVDLAFLFDGSLSMTSDEFNQNKKFIMEIMRSLDNTSIKFAAVQFSMIAKTVFNFNDYQRGTAIDKLMNEPHMYSLTNTHMALKFVLEEIFEKPEAGASSDSTKVLVLITDGDPSDEDTKGIIQKYNEKRIIRFVIGRSIIGSVPCCADDTQSYFSGKSCSLDKVKDVSMEKFEAMVSEPKDKYAFKIENYNGLTGILENFQNRIFKMEGSDEARAGDMTNEMSQSGFSAVYHKDTLILGSVGSNVWRGSLQEFNGQKYTQIEDPHMKNDSYLGYSTSVGEKKNTILYFTGAPRFEHTGMVVLFKHDGKSWAAAQRINGEQIGSYFGAELCSVDINSDGNTDFLLVGAPQFYQPQEKREGQIYVYTLTDEMQLKSKLNVTAPSMGRFGTTISSLADLNGDGLRDIAVGAPLEDDNGGAVYLFLGDRHKGIRSTFSQRIMGQKIKPGLRFFGQAIDGDIDLGDDSLPDIVVGSQGNAVVLSSRPVFNVKAHLSFQPEEISTEKIDCLGNTDEILPMVDLTACFEMVETTKSKTGAASSGLNISYMLDLDPIRQTYRGFFSQTDKKARNFTSTYELRKNYTCLSHHIYMPKCVKDTLSPIGIKLNFAEVDTESASAVLNVDSKRQAFIEIPFEKQCRQNDTCIAELMVDFDFMTKTLLVAEDNYFNVSITLTNQGDDSYNTSLSMHYPTGLSFSRMTAIKFTRPTLHSCHDLDGILDKTICGVSLPVYRSGSSVTFLTSFHIMNEYEWDDTVSMTIIGKSDNSNSNLTNSMTKTVPVQFEIKMALTVREETVTYMNFTPEDTAPKKMVVMYKIDNPGLKAFPINVSFVFPTKLEHNFEMENYEVFVRENKTKCTGITDVKSEYCSPEKHCKVIVCDSFILDRESSTDFNLTGDIQFRDLQQQAATMPFLQRYTGDGSEVKFKSFMHVSYDEQRYVLDSHKQERKTAESGYRKDPTMKWTEVRVEFIIFPNELMIISTGVGLGVLLLIIIAIIMLKLGCFKRKTVQYYQDQEEEAALQASSSIKSTGAPTNGKVSQSETDSKSDQPPDEKLLLDKDEANSNNVPADTEEELN